MSLSQTCPPARPAVPCQGCGKQFSYDKALLKHIEKTTQCSARYKEEGMDLPVVKERRKKEKPPKEADGALESPSGNINTRVDDEKKEDGVQKKEESVEKMDKVYYPLELRVATVLKIKKAGFENLETIAEDAAVPLRVAMKWWKNKEKYFKLEELRQVKLKAIEDNKLTENKDALEEKDVIKSPEEVLQKYQDIIVTSSSRVENKEEEENICPTIGAHGGMTDTEQDMEYVETPEGEDDDQGNHAEVEAEYEEATLEEDRQVEEETVQKERHVEEEAVWEEEHMEEEAFQEESKMEENTVHEERKVEEETIEEERKVEENTFHERKVEEEPIQEMRQEKVEVVKKDKRLRTKCGSCSGCSADDCAKCRHCLDKVKFGGRGKIRQRCIARNCTNSAKSVEKKLQKESVQITLEKRKDNCKKYGKKEKDKLILVPGYDQPEEDFFVLEKTKDQIDLEAKMDRIIEQQQHEEQRKQQEEQRHQQEWQEQQRIEHHKVEQVRQEKLMQEEQRQEEQRQEQIILEVQQRQEQQMQEQLRKEQQWLEKQRQEQQMQEQLRKEQQWLEKQRQEQQMQEQQRQEQQRQELRRQEQQRQEQQRQELQRKEQQMQEQQWLEKQRQVQPKKEQLRKKPKNLDRRKVIFNRKKGTKQEMNKQVAVSENEAYVLEKTKDQVDPEENKLYDSETLETRLGRDFTIIKVVKETSGDPLTDHIETEDSESLETRLGKEITVIKVAKDTIDSPIADDKDTAAGIVEDKVERNNVDDAVSSQNSHKDKDDKSEEEKEFSIFDIGDMEKRDFGGVTISKQKESAPIEDCQTTPNNDIENDFNLSDSDDESINKDANKVTTTEEAAPYEDYNPNEHTEVEAPADLGEIMGTKDYSSNGRMVSEEDTLGQVTMTEHQACNEPVEAGEANFEEVILDEESREDVVTVMSDTEEAVSTIASSSNYPTQHAYEESMETDEATFEEGIELAKEDAKAAENLMRAMDGIAEDDEEISSHREVNVEVDDSMDTTEAPIEEEIELANEDTEDNPDVDKPDAEDEKMANSKPINEDGEETTVCGFTALNATSTEQFKDVLDPTSKATEADNFSMITDSLIFQLKVVPQAPAESRAPGGGKKRRSAGPRCLQCPACLRPNCGRCRFCRDLKTNGGTARLRKPCQERTCLRRGEKVQVQEQKIGEQRQEQLRLEQQRQEQQRLEQQVRVEKQKRLEQLKMERHRLELQKEEQQSLERQKIEEKRHEQQKQEEHRLNEQKLEEKRQEQEIMERQRLEEHRLEQQKQEQLWQEKQHVEEQRREEQRKQQEEQRLQQEWQEQQRKEQHKVEQLRQENRRQDKIRQLEEQRQEQQRQEQIIMEVQQRQEQQRQEQQMQEQLGKERQSYEEQIQDQPKQSQEEAAPDIIEIQPQEENTQHQAGTKWQKKKERRREQERRREERMLQQELSLRNPGLLLTRSDQGADNFPVQSSQHPSLSQTPASLPASPTPPSNPRPSPSQFSIHTLLEPHTREKGGMTLPPPQQFHLPALQPQQVRQQQQQQPLPQLPRSFQPVVRQDGQQLQQASPWLGAPQLAPQMAPDMSSPQMDQQRSSPQMGQQRSFSQMDQQRISPRMNPHRSSPQMNTQTSFPQMYPQVSISQMDEQRSPPQTVPQRSSPQPGPHLPQQFTPTSSEQYLGQHTQLQQLTAPFQQSTAQLQQPTAPFQQSTAQLQQPNAPFQPYQVTTNPFNSLPTGTTAFPALGYQILPSYDQQQQQQQQQQQIQQQKLLEEAGRLLQQQVSRDKVTLCFNDDISEVLGMMKPEVKAEVKPEPSDPPVLAPYNQPEPQQQQAPDPERVVTLFPSSLSLPPTSSLTLPSLETFRGLTAGLVRGEVTAGEAARASGLEEGVVALWLQSLEDVLAVKEETVQQARRFREVRREVGRLGEVLGELHVLLRGQGVEQGVQEGVNRVREVLETMLQ